MTKYRKIVAVLIVLAICLAFTACEIRDGNDDGDKTPGTDYAKTTVTGPNESLDNSETTPSVPNNPSEYTEGLEFELNDDGKTVKVVGYKGESAQVVIPAIYGGKSVTKIEDFAFSACLSVVDVFLPDSLTSIGNYAFSGCLSMVSITVPEGVTSIGEKAFHYCVSLKNVSVPESLVQIGADAFLKCEALDHNEYDNALYLGNSSNPYLMLVSAKSNEIGNCSINPNTALINHLAFKDCYWLESVVIPDSVIYIGQNAFEGCTAVKEIDILGGVTCIDDYAFYMCIGLVSINIPDSVSFIGEYAFQGCDFLADINFEGTAAQWEAIEKGLGWDSFIKEYTIHCADEDISK